MLDNLFTGIPGSLPVELLETLLATDEVRIERIVSLGHASPPGFWYDQDQAEWVVLMQGAARLSFEGQEKAIDMKPGDFINIPARRRHRVDWTDPAVATVWLAVHYDGCRISETVSEALDETARSRSENEVVRLQARVAELERELTEQRQRRNKT